MKKTYIAPEMMVENIELESMIAASDPKVFTDEVNASNAESRDDALFFDEED